MKDEGLISFIYESLSRKVTSAPPPPSQRGEGVRGREADSASSRNEDIRMKDK